VTAAADCSTVTRWPATVTLPVRAGPVVASTVKLTVPVPVPDAPAVTAIHESFALAVHVQPAGAVTATEAGPPALPIETPVGATA
jgi:hypothetical protein